jgi:hypothetical protein
VVACAEAGIAGYVTHDDSVAELVGTIRDATRGEFRCPPHIAACLVRLAVVGAQARQPVGCVNCDTACELRVACRSGIVRLPYHRFGGYFACCTDSPT